MQGVVDQIVEQTMQTAVVDRYGAGYGGGIHLHRHRTPKFALPRHFIADGVSQNERRTIFFLVW